MASAWSLPRVAARGLLLLMMSTSTMFAARAADEVAGDYFVHSLPGQPPGPLVKMHAGFVRRLSTAQVQPRQQEADDTDDVFLDADTSRSLQSTTVTSFFGIFKTSMSPTSNAPSSG